MGGGKTPADLIRVVEAAYEVAPSPRKWLAGITRAARPLLDTGGGGFSALTNWDGRTVHVDEVLADRGFKDVAEFVIDRSPKLTAPDMAQTYMSPIVFGTMAERLGGRRAYEHHWLRGEMGRRKRFDFATLVAFDPSGSGCVMAWERPTHKATPRRIRTAWTRLSFHILAGLRLQKTLGKSSSSSSLNAAEAVLEFSRKGIDVVHADGAAKHKGARTALREAAHAIDKARTTRGRTDDEAALEVWRGLVSGRWSLIDLFDTDGRRFVIAHRNEPGAPPLLALSNRERQILGYVAIGHSNKLIAYALGLSASTIAEHLRRALLKTGLRSRIDVVRLFGQAEWQ